MSREVPLTHPGVPVILDSGTGVGDTAEGPAGPRTPIPGGIHVVD